jgi:hypothetical protein
LAIAVGRRRIDSNFPPSLHPTCAREEGTLGCFSMRLLWVEDCARTRRAKFVMLQLDQVHENKKKRTLVLRNNGLDIFRASFVINSETTTSNTVRSNTTEADKNEVESYANGGGRTHEYACVKGMYDIIHKLLESGTFASSKKRSRPDERAVMDGLRLLIWDKYFCRFLLSQHIVLTCIDFFYETDLYRLDSVLVHRNFTYHKPTTTYQP